jgi:hypothetical protein
MSVLIFDRTYFHERKTKTRQKDTHVYIPDVSCVLARHVVTKGGCRRKRFPESLLLDPVPLVRRHHSSCHASSTHTVYGHCALPDVRLENGCVQWGQPMRGLQEQNPLTQRPLWQSAAAVQRPPPFCMWHCRPYCSSASCDVRREWDGRLVVSQLSVRLHQCDSHGLKMRTEMVQLPQM